MTKELQSQSKYLITTQVSTILNKIYKKPKRSQVSKKIITSIKLAWFFSDTSCVSIALAFTRISIKKNRILL